MPDLELLTVGEIVTENYRTASVFNKYKIDFCCNGNVNFKEACAKKNVSPDTVLNELNSYFNVAANSDVGYDNWQLDVLASHIVNKHHSYVTSKIPELQKFLEKICSVHGSNHPELFRVKDLFMASAGELTMHMKKEELILFPFVHKMVNAKSNNLKIDFPQFGSVNNPIQMMIAEHSNEGDRFRLIEQITNNYTPPSDGCATYKVSFALLKEFQDDLHLHIHLENNILFPKAVLLEKELFSNN